MSLIVRKQIIGGPPTGEHRRALRCLKKPYPSRRDVLVGLAAEIFMAAHELRFVKAHASHMGDAEGLSAT